MTNCYMGPMKIIPLNVRGKPEWTSDEIVSAVERFEKLLTVAPQYNYIRQLTDNVTTKRQRKNGTFAFSYKHVTQRDPDCKVSRVFIITANGFIHLEKIYDFGGEVRRFRQGYRTPPMTGDLKQNYGILLKRVMELLEIQDLYY